MQRPAGVVVEHRQVVNCFGGHADQPPRSIRYAVATSSGNADLTAVTVIGASVLIGYWSDFTAAVAAPQRQNA
jgi:hypothetical protein